MRFDIFDQLSNKQVFTASAVSTNSIKRKNLKKREDINDMMGLAIFVDAVGTAPSTSLTVELIQADDGALTTNVQSLKTLNIPLADIKAGNGFFLELSKMTKEYFGARVVPTGGTPSVTMSVYYGSEHDVANYASFQTPYTVANN